MTYSVWNFSITLIRDNDNNNIVDVTPKLITKVALTNDIKGVSDIETVKMDIIIDVETNTCIKDAITGFISADNEAEAQKILFDYSDTLY